MAHSHERGTENLRHTAQQTAEAASRQISDAEDRIRQQAALTAGRARALGDRARRAALDHESGLAEYARDNPLATAGLAFVAGVLVASLIRR